jgi:serine O-acetyltransferase
LPIAIWNQIVAEVNAATINEPFLNSFLTMTLLKHSSIYEALSYYLAERLENNFISGNDLQLLFLETIGKSDAIRKSVIEDLQAIRDRDPASGSYLNPFLNYKGYHALESYRVAHDLWLNGRIQSALILQSLISQKFGVDIHPAAKIGRRLFIDHATGIVIGETAVIGDDVSMLHEVTLGGTGKETGDRHPKIGNGVLIGAGAKILGNIHVGDGAKVGAGSVVLTDVPPHTTVAGVPAKIIGKPKTSIPSLEMDQSIDSV